MNPFTNKKASIFREKSRLQKTYADIIVKRITICFILIGKQLEKYEKTGKTEKQSGLRDSESTTENGTDNSLERRKNLTRKTPESQT